MRILLSNDDGYSADGIQQLHAALKDQHQVTLVAPERNKSGASNSLTLTRPISARLVAPGQYAVDGTPADCVHLALTGLIGERPDLVVSGINDGANMGEDTLYSGTVAAAMEGFLVGIPAIAFSMTRKPPQHWATGVAMALKLIASWQAQPPKAPMLWSVNIPDLPLHQIQGFQSTRLGRRHHAEPMIPTTSPRGETWYWVGAAGAALDNSEGTDFHATESGFVSVTPLQVDLTQHSQISPLAQWLATA
jgi:5'-nucleotidase